MLEGCGEDDENFTTILCKPPSQSTVHILQQQCARWVENEMAKLINTEAKKQQKEKKGLDSEGIEPPTTR